MTFYIDQGGCGVRGNDARADFSQCTSNGYRQISQKSLDWNDPDVIDGCAYYEWKLYKCNRPLTSAPTLAPTASVSSQ